MMTTVVQQTSQEITNAIPPNVLIVGKKNALDYIAPALFRIGSLGELVVRAKGSLSIVTAVNVAEMVKKDVAALATKSVSIGTEQVSVDGIPKRVSYIEIHLARPALAANETLTPAEELDVKALKRTRTKRKKAAAKKTTRKKSE